MMARLPVSLFHRLVPLAAHRLAVIDPGRHGLKVLVAESSLGHLRVLHRQTVNLPDEGVLEADDLRQHLEVVLPELGRHEVALVLPQHRTITQTLDLPADAETEPGTFLAAEARRLSGLAAEAIIVSFTPLLPYANRARPHLLTFCKQEEVANLINRYVPAAADSATEQEAGPLVEITTTAQALFAASRALRPVPENAVLVDLGAQETVVAILFGGQGVFATSFEGGSQQFTQALAESRPLTPEAAEALKRTQNLFQGAEAVEAVARTAENWHAQLRRALAEWQEDFPELQLPPGGLPVYLCGGGAAQPGLIEFLNHLGQLRFQRWPGMTEEAMGEPMDAYWVAYGAARVALGRQPRPLSLLPVEFRKRRRLQRAWEGLQAIIVAFLAVTLVLLVAGTWQKARLLQRKRELMTRTSAVLESAKTVAELAQRVEAGYASIDPLVYRQRQTLEVLQTWAAVNQVRTNNDFWFVLFGDTTSYQTGTTLPQPATNQTGSLSAPSGAPTPSRSEFIAEICIPQEGDAARRVLNQTLATLKRQRIFSSVDALPAERKREWVDPRVFISNRVFGVAMEWAPAEWPRPFLATTDRPVSETRPRGSKRRATTPLTAPTQAALTNSLTNR